MATALLPVVRLTSAAYTDMVASSAQVTRG